jgi:hypothetical protein
MRRQTKSSKFGKFGNRQSKQRSRRAAQRRPLLSLETLESRNMMAVTAFQFGAGGYEGQQDTVIFSLEPDSNFGTEGHISSDQQDFNSVRQGLLKFGDIFGDEPGQIPYGATINSAQLKVFVQDSSNASMQMSLYRMLKDWDESTATWNFFGATTGGIGGVQASEGESSNLPPDSVLFDSKITANSATAGIFDVTKSLEYWAAGASNYGWLIETAATNGWDFRTNNSNQADRPVLTVNWNMPAATGDFQILNTSVTQAEGNTGTRVAKVEVARLGNISAATSINYTITSGGANPAQSGDFVAVPTPQTLNFAANQGLATIEVTINGDDELEGLETVLVSLSGGTTVTGRGAATVTIGDDDILINEVLANVSNSSDETNREYIELTGTPGADLTGYYFVVFEGEEEENSGAGSGRADFVINLAPYTFGSNGIMTFVPGDPGVEGLTWEYASIADPDSNIVELSSLMVAGGVLEDSSQTYALVYSPTTAITQGTDYDTIGTYESAIAEAIGTGVGLLDQLPADAQWIDSVGTVEGGSGDRDRVATPPTLGSPGIHVHHPTSVLAPANTAVAADAISRRFGQTLPNSIGVWYNGDISSGALTGSTIPYLEDSAGFISVIAPDGAALTPGAPNILRNVYWRLLDQNKEVAEIDGSVTLRIERTGDIDDESLTVTYSTFDFGSADEGTDYTGKTGTVTFDEGVSFVDITIDINEADGVSEGFERFQVVLSNASGGYKITNGSPTGAGNVNGVATVTIVDANVSIAKFQNGVNGYSGTSDAFLDAEASFDKFGQDPVIKVDQAATSTLPQQALLRFDNMFGSALNQVPTGAKIFDAFLTLNVSNAASGADIRFFRMLQDWEEVNATWADPQGNAGGLISNGVTPDGIEATAKEDARVTLPGKAGKVQIPLNVKTIQSWANGSLTNFGWSIISDDPTQWWFNSEDAFALGTFKPELTILYTDPVDSDKGTFSFSADNYTANESPADGLNTVTVRVNRIGGSDGAATVNWAVSNGTGTSPGTLADLTGATSGSISFADGELYETITLTVNNDALLERTETLDLTLSGVGLAFGQGTATLSIRDNDFVPASGNLLLNEIWINSPGNDPPQEFVELRGLANMAMGSIYYVAIEGLSGPAVGAFEKVVDLGKYANGSNGLSLLTAPEEGFSFNVNPSTTHIQDLGPIGVENVSSNNDSTTYMLLYSPSRELTDFAFDWDWDNDGQLELPLGATAVDALGVRTNEADQVYGLTTSILTFPPEEVDAVSRKRDDVDRNDGSAWFGGNLTSAGDDYLLYDHGTVGNPPTPASFNRPVEGAAMTPGDVNTGTAAQSPLVALTSVTPNALGTVTVSFNGLIQQVVAGDGSSAAATGAGITITDTSGQPIPIIDLRPVVTGIGTNSLTLSFNGSGVVGGKLPAGTYQLNFVGNGIVANGRAVDVANNGTQLGGSFEFEFTATTVVVGDYDLNGSVEQADYAFWKSHYGDNDAVALQADGNGNGVVDTSDYTVWRDHFTPGGSAAGGTAAILVQQQQVAVPTGQTLLAAAVPTVADTSEFPAAPKALDLAFIDAAFAGRATTTMRGKAAGADAASLRIAAGGSAPFDRSLLLATRQSRHAAGPGQQEEPHCAERGGDDSSATDTFFAKLGEGNFARRGLRHAI